MLKAGTYKYVATYKSNTYANTQKAKIYYTIGSFLQSYYGWVFKVFKYANKWQMAQVKRYT